MSENFREVYNNIPYRYFFDNERIKKLNISEHFFSDSSYRNSHIKCLNGVRTELVNISFANSKIKKANFFNGELENVNFKNVTFHSINFNKSHLKDVNFRNAKMREGSCLLRRLIGAKVYVKKIKKYKKITMKNKEKYAKILKITSN